MSEAAVEQQQHQPQQQSSPQPSTRQGRGGHAHAKRGGRVDGAPGGAQVVAATSTNADASVSSAPSTTATNTRPARAADVLSVTPHKPVSFYVQLGYRLLNQHDQITVRGIGASVQPCLEVGSSLVRSGRAKVVSLRTGSAQVTPYIAQHYPHAGPPGRRPEVQWRLERVGDKVELTHLTRDQLQYIHSIEHDRTAPRREKVAGEEGEGEGEGEGEEIDPSAVEAAQGEEQ